MTPKVSVLTPVYNVAEYLPQCLDSLKRQTLRDIEFVCINDGSTDGSLAILERYAADDARFKVIDKENEGYGASMNRGLAAAEGEYIGILESDDYIAPDAFERLYGLAKAQGDCDVVKADYFTFDEKHGERYVENLPADLCGRPLDPSAPGNSRVVIPTPAIWSAIYRRAFVEENGIRFLETPGAAFQDTGFVMKCFIAAERVYLTSDAFVRYRTDNGGSSVKARDKVFNVCEEYHSIESFLDERPEKRAALITAVNAAKFNTYRWNKNRIAWDLRPEFLEVFAREFRAARAVGELEESLTLPERWHEFEEIAEDPQAYYERTRAAASCRRLCRESAKAVGDAKASPPQLAVVLAPRGDSLDDLWRVFRGLRRQRALPGEIVLPSVLVSVLRLEPASLECLRVVEGADRAEFLQEALRRVEAPYVCVLEDPVWHGKGALDEMLVALEGSRAGFAVAPIVHGRSDSRTPLETSAFVFDARPEPPAKALAVDATLNDKLFRTSALNQLEGVPDAARAFASLSFARVPGARLVTNMNEADFLRRVPLRARLRFRRWYRKR